MVKISDEMERIKGLRPTATMPSAMREAMAFTSAIKSPAQWTYERLVKYIQAFEEKLDDEQEIGARLVSFGSELTFHIENIGYHGPDIITFYGTNNLGEDVQLIQNISQLSVLLVAMKKVGDEPRRIGYRLTSDEPEDETEDGSEE